MRLNFTELSFHLERDRFNLANIKQCLENIPNTTPDPIRPFPHIESYMICGYPGYVSSCIEKRRNGDPNVFPWGCSVIHLNASATDIGIGFYGNDEDPRFIEAAKFVLWLLNEYDCKVTDNEGQDWTDKVKQKGPAVLFE